MSRYGGVVLAAAAMVLLGLAAIFLTDAVVNHGTLRGLDDAVRNWAIDRRTAVLTGVLTAVTWLGSTPSLIVLALAAASWLAFRDRRADAVLVLGTTASVLALGPVLKGLFERARPVADHLVAVDSWAYPSGHSLNSLTVFGVLTVVAVQRSGSRGWPWWVPSAVLVAAIGFSRVYLGVHWPSDVLAGWLMGVLWLTICLTVAGLVRRG